MSSEAAAPSPTGTTSAVLRFVAAGVVAAAVISAGAYWVVSRNAVAEATRNAQEIAAIDGRDIVAPALTDAVLAGNASAVAVFDNLVKDRVLSARVVRTKVWTPQGRILYSDAAALAGRTFSLSPEELGAINDNRVVAEVSELNKPENQYERGYGRLLEVYLPIRSVSGQTFLFETYQVYSSIEDDQRRIWLTFFPVLVGGILLLFAVQVPLAWRMARDLRSAQIDREALLKRALDASAAERRRIARDLHDGVVQALAGVAFGLGAAAGRGAGAVDAEMEATLRQSSGAIRQAVRDLRSLIVEIAPPNLAGPGLASALTDLVTPLQADGIETSVSVTGLESLNQEEATLLYRAAAEAIRNASTHAGATRLDVVGELVDGSVKLAVHDNGRGFTADQVIARQQEGHIGLAMLRSLVEDGGGELRVSSTEVAGSTIEVTLDAA